MRHIIPNSATCLSLLCGYLSLLASSQQQITLAVGLILAAALADALDGKLARMLGTTSTFGQQLDSLADVVSFGVAPALLVYWAGLNVVPGGVFIGFIPLLCAVLRLARFNTSGKSHEFVGLPAPMGALLLAGSVLLEMSTTWLSFWILMAGGLMISLIPYPAAVPSRYSGIVLGGLLVVTAMLDVRGVLFAAAVAYSLYGITRSIVPVVLRRRVRARPQRPTVGLSTAETHPHANQIG